ncbi:hypothetical protein KCP73_05940 [Salmonella enterica subsp. enterica]|nr:hypothetical protein KCP73_05940 [Salmonella enterica subsp. enterica]
MTSDGVFGANDLRSCPGARATLINVIACGDRDHQRGLLFRLEEISPPMPGFYPRRKRYPRPERLPARFAPHYADWSYGAATLSGRVNGQIWPGST